MSVKIRITAGGIYGGDGKEVPLGTEITLSQEPAEWAGRYIVVGDDDGKEAVTGLDDEERQELEALRGENADLKSQLESALAAKGDDDGKEDAADTAKTYEARDTGSGWWTIFDNEGNEVGKKLRKDDAEGFNGFSDADKAEFIQSQDA